MTAAAYLADLIRIPSVSSLSNRNVMKYAQNVLHKAGWTTRELSYLDDNGIEKVNLIAAPPGQDVTAHTVDLAFVCHTDTVPFATSWTTALEPFTRNGMLHGCGACDVKGFLACLLEAATSQPSSWRSGTRIVLTADEEVGCLGAKHLLARNAIKSRRLVIGEPTSLHVARAGKGYCLAEVIVRGREAHSALPEQGVSAIFAASRLIVAVEGIAEELKQHTNDLFQPAYPSLHVGVVQGGTAKNIIAGECRFLVEWRPIPGLDPLHVPAALRAAADELQATTPGIQCSVTVLREQNGFETPAAATIVQRIAQSTGRAPTSIPFGSEASIFASLAEEIVVFGPGDMRTAHSDRECVPLSELQSAVAVICDLAHATIWA